MGLVELKTFRPVCDHCGKVGSTWTNLPEHEKEKAVPDGWRWMPSVEVRLPATGDLVCDVCLSGGLDSGQLNAAGYVKGTKT